MATLVDLAIGKGGVWIDHGSEKGSYGFKCAVKKMLEKMLEKMLNFKELSARDHRGYND